MSFEVFRPRPVADEFAHIYLEEGQEKTHGGLLQLMDLLAGPGRLLVRSNGFEPHKLDLASIPAGLQIIQRGNDLRHYEITPAPGTSLKVEQYTALLRLIRTVT